MKFICSYCKRIRNSDDIVIDADMFGVTTGLWMPICMDCLRERCKNELKR